MNLGLERFVVEFTNGRFNAEFAAEAPQGAEKTTGFLRALGASAANSALK